MVIFDRKNLNQELTIGEVPGTMYGLNPGSGWIDQELFPDWFERHFLQYAPAVRPLLLLLDGHSTHYQPEVVRLAATNGVIMFALPPPHNPCCTASGCHVFSCSQNILGSGVQQVEDPLKYVIEGLQNIAGENALSGVFLLGMYTSL